MPVLQGGAAHDDRDAQRHRAVPHGPAQGEGHLVSTYYFAYQHGGAHGDLSLGRIECYGNVCLESERDACGCAIHTCTHNP